MPAPKEIIELVERFECNIEEYKLGRYNEAQVRQEYINPFFEALGWDMNNKHGLAEAYKDVIHEDSIKIGMGTKAPDYCFRIGGTRKFFLEAKNPSVNIRDNIDPSYQIRRYAWSAKLPLSILTDFEEFSVYDTRIKPKKNDKASTARILYFTFRDYIDKWDEIASIFSRDAIIKGSFDKYVESTKKKRGTAEVDIEFLDEIEKWRAELAKDIAKNNRKISQSSLNYSIQKIIDRIIFLRICEDRGIEDYGKLQALLNGPHAYQRLCEDFERADQKYNSGLFHFKTEKDIAESPDEITLKLKVSDDAVKNIIKNLYFPDSPYEFSVITADILGKVYEQFLGKVIRLTSGHRVVIEEKPEVRKAGGVYYTPVYIVDYIVRNTVGKLLEGKTPEQASKLKILDPACGSGSFLIGAYQLLLDWHLEWYINNNPKEWAMKKKPAVYQSTHGGWKLTISERKRILLNNIHGVDIDPQAVEVTKLSLLLKVLEGDVDPYLKQQLSMSFMTERALPDLGNNIKCGNSLIGPDFYDGKNLSLFGVEEMEKINTFDWNSKEKGFGEIMSKGGFDAVIGNPPYFNVETLGIKSQEIEHIKKKYSNVWMDKSDILFYFLYKATILSKDAVCFIVSNAFLFADKAQKLRSYIASQFPINKIVNFEKYRVFPDASITTAIVLLNKKIKQKTLALPFVEKSYSVNEIIEALNNPKRYIEVNLKKESPFALIDAHVSKLNNKIDGNNPKLSNLFLVGSGMQTGENDVFVFTNPPSNIPNTYIKKRMSGEIIEKYYIGKPKEYLLYVEECEDYEKLPGSVKKYLIKNKAFLANRADKIRRKTAKWWNYTFAMHKESYNLNKIWCSYRSKNNAFVYDDTKEFVGLTNTTVIFETNKDVSLKYILALLNSKVLNFRYKSIGKQTGGGIYEYFENGVGKLPIPVTNREEQDVFIKFVDQMLEMQKRLHSARSESDKKHIQQKVEVLDKQIDALVYELYGLTEEEIKVVEGAYGDI